MPLGNEKAKAIARKNAKENASTAAKWDISLENVRTHLSMTPPYRR